MEQPSGYFHAEISIFAQGCVTVTLRFSTGDDLAECHAHVGPFPDLDAIGHAVRETFALWVAGDRGEEIEAPLALL